MSIRKTSRRLQLMSDSNYRFERGVDPMGVDEASLRACQLIVELAGGQVADGAVDVWAKPAQPWQLALRPERTTRLLGLEIPASRQAEILSRLGLGARLEGGKIVCTIPTFRQDLTREVDLIEEVARLNGFDKIPVSNRITHAVSAEGVQQRTRRELGQVLVAAGFDEAMTPTFVDAGENELFGLADPILIDSRVRRTNNALRGTLLPSLLKCCKTNQDAGIADVSVFELAKVFPRSEPRTEVSGLGNSRPEGSGPCASHLPREFTELAMLTTRDLRFLRGAMEVVIQRLAPQAKVEFRTLTQPRAAVPQTSQAFAPGAAAEIFLDGHAAGDLGMIDSAPLGHYGLEKPLAAGRLNFEMLLAYAGTVRQYTPVPRFPAVHRDLSLVVAEAVTWRQIEQAVAAASQPMRVALEYVVTYRGKPIPAGSKSVTITLTYRSSEGTLRGEQVDEQVQQVVGSLQHELAAEIRK
jgi:phenylalanyl-tRNA synthetase beta chain